MYKDKNILRNWKLNTIEEIEEIYKSSHKDCFELLELFKTK
jgi:hypothetical protein